MNPWRIGVTVDIVLFTVRDGRLDVLLIERKIPPYRGRWAIPGGFVLEGESLENAALRELREETGVRNVFLEQLYTFGDPDRDPRGRVVTVAHYALVAADRVTVAAGSDAQDARWFPAAEPPRLAFDHARILRYALERLRNKLEYTTVGFQLLPPKFTLGELQTVHEAILDRKLDKRNFRRDVLKLGIVRPLRETRKSGRRPARLHAFTAQDTLDPKALVRPF